MSDFELSINNLNAWLSTIGSTHAFPTLKLDANGVCAVAFEGIPAIQLRVSSGGENLILTTFVLKLFASAKADLLETLLRWNYEAAFLQGACLGFCQHSKQITLSVSFEISGLSDTTLYNVLQNFCTTTRTVIEKCNALQQEPTSPDGHASDNAQLINGTGFFKV